MYRPFGERLAAVGLAMLRYGLVVILFLFGAAKWTTHEAEAIRPWAAASPFLSWLYAVAGTQGVSIVIGVIEIVAAGLIALRRWSPAASAVGSGIAAGMFMVTLSFLFTTPSQSPEAQGFLLKDYFLLSVAVWSLGESVTAQIHKRS